MGKPDVSKMRTTAFRLSGHAAAGPRGVEDQSNALTRVLITGVCGGSSHPSPRLTSEAVLSCIGPLPNWLSKFMECAATGRIDPLPNGLKHRENRNNLSFLVNLNAGNAGTV